MWCQILLLLQDKKCVQKIAKENVKKIASKLGNFILS